MNFLLHLSRRGLDASNGWDCVICVTAYFVNTVSAQATQNVNNPKSWCFISCWTWSFWTIRWMQQKVNTCNVNQYRSSKKSTHTQKLKKWSDSIRINIEFIVTTVPICRWNGVFKIRAKRKKVFHKLMIIKSIE